MEEVLEIGVWVAEIVWPPEVVGKRVRANGGDIT